MIIISGAGDVTATAPIPSTIADMWEWWEPSRETGYIDGDFMPSMLGQVAPGTGHDFVQAAADVNKPTFQTNELNGLAVVEFNGASGRSFNSVNPSALTAAHLFLIVKMDSANSATSPWDFGTAFDENHYEWLDGNIYDGTASSSRYTVGNPTPAVTSWRLIEVISTSSEWTFLMDGSQLFTTGTNTVSLSSSCKLGANRGRGCSGKAAGGYLFSAKKTGTDRTTLVDYANDRFAQAFS